MPMITVLLIIMENLDPVGIHTRTACCGSAQTLTDEEYQIRSASIKIIRSENSRGL